MFCESIGLVGTVSTGGPVKNINKRLSTPYPIYLKLVNEQRFKINIVVYEFLRTLSKAEY